jgi:hypothetical protein
MFSKVRQAAPPDEFHGLRRKCLARTMLGRQKPHRKTFSRKTYQRGSRGWRACPW